MAEAATHLLRQVEVFAGLPEPELRKIVRILRERRVSQNQVLFRQGDPSDALYIIVDGRVRISLTAPGGEDRVLAFLGTGDIVGEMGLLTEQPRSASATASTNVLLLQLRKADFDALLANNLELMRELARVVARRRESTRERLISPGEGKVDGGGGVITALFSPRGGAGNTMLATNLAVALAYRVPDRVVIVDLNVFGHVPLMLNLMPRTSLAAISPGSLRQMDFESFQFYLTTHAQSSLRLLASVLRPEEGEMVTPDHVRAALDRLRQNFQHVIVDLSRGFAEANLTAIEAATNILITCTPDRQGARAVAETQRVFRDLLRLPGDPLQYVLNQRSAYASVGSEELESTLNVRFAERIPFGGDAPGRAALEGQPLVSRFPHSPVARAVVSLARRLEQQVQEFQALQAPAHERVAATSA